MRMMIGFSASVLVTCFLLLDKLGLFPIPPLFPCAHECAYVVLIRVLVLVIYPKVGHESQLLFEEL